jgi:hypothetical protein
MLAVLASFDAARSAARRMVLVLMNSWLLVKKYRAVDRHRFEFDDF